jgi:general secretion pathway protein C
MTLRLVAFVIWAAVAASAMFWALRLGASAPAAPVHTVAAVGAAPVQGDLTRVFGAAPVRETGGSDVVVETALSSRFKLLGVAAPRQGGDRNGLALIAVDGKPARSYAVGAAVDGDLLLQSVHTRGARLGAKGSAPQVTLELPALPLPATGSLPMLQGPSVGVPPGGVMPGAVAAPPMPVPIDVQPPAEPLPTPRADRAER